MERIDLPSLYNLGSALSTLMSVRTETSSRIDVYFKGTAVEQHLDSLLTTFPSLTVCRAAVDEFNRANKLAMGWMGKKSFSDPWEQEETWSVQALVLAAQKVETLLTAELQTLATYHASQKAIYSTPDLIERADNIFPEATRAKLPPNVLEEVKQSGRCLAFDNATAAGFHILRAVEAAMHEYYVEVCGVKPRPDRRLPSWSVYIRELDTSADAGVKRVVALLQQIKDHDRNPLMHPELILSQDEALTLFEISQGAIMAMADGLPSPKPRIPRASRSSKALPPPP